MATRAWRSLTLAGITPDDRLHHSAGAADRGGRLGRPALPGAAKARPLLPAVQLRPVPDQRVPVSRGFLADERGTEFLAQDCPAIELSARDPRHIPAGLDGEMPA